MSLEGVEVDEQGRRVVRNKDGEIISRKSNDWDLSRFYCGTWGGIQVYTHSCTPAFMLAFTVVESMLSGDKALMVAYCLFYSILLWVSIILHELCIAYLARRYGAQVEKILVWPLGGFGNTGLVKDAGEDIWIALVGPLSHVPFIIMFGVIVYSQNSVHNLVLSTHTITEKFSLYFALGMLAQQMLLFVVNLMIPLYPFDAGRTFMNMCATRGVPVRRAVQASTIIGAFWFVAGAGFFVYQLAVHNGGYSRGLFILIFGWMIYQISTKWLTKSDDACRKLRLTQPYLMWNLRMEDAVKAAPDSPTNPFGKSAQASAAAATAISQPALAPAEATIGGPPADFEENPWAQGQSTTDEPDLDLSNPFG